MCPNNPLLLSRLLFLHKKEFHNNTLFIWIDDTSIHFEAMHEFIALFVEFLLELLFCGSTRILFAYISEPDCLFTPHLHIEKPILQIVYQLLRYFSKRKYFLKIKVWIRCVRHGISSGVLFIEKYSEFNVNVLKIVETTQPLDP